MEPKDVIRTRRIEKGLSQEALAAQVYVTRQAVSRWETGETVPNPETLKRLSRVLDVSINTLLGAPRQLVCQCCGMPLEEGLLSREPDGARRSSSTSVRLTWPRTGGPPTRYAPTWKPSCPSSGTGKNNAMRRRARREVPGGRVSVF